MSGVSRTMFADVRSAVKVLYEPLPRSVMVALKLPINEALDWR